MAKTAMEKQEQLIGQFMRTAKWANKSTVKSAVQTCIEDSAKRKAEFEKKQSNKDPKVYIGGIGYSNLTQEQADAIRAKNIAEIENRDANKKARRKAKAAAAKAKRIQAAIDAQAEKDRAFKAMIARKAQEQIAARNK